VAGAPNWVARHEKDEFPANLVPAWLHEFVALGSFVGPRLVARPLTHLHCLPSAELHQRNFPDYPLLKMAETPDVEVHLVNSQVDPGGAGEMGIATIAPALCNAIFDACGTRIRSLPIGNQLRDAAPKKQGAEKG